LLQVSAVVHGAGAVAATAGVVAVAAGSAAKAEEATRRNVKMRMETPEERTA
jgi:hypothetical protein